MTFYNSNFSVIRTKYLPRLEFELARVYCVYNIKTVHLTKLLFLFSSYLFGSMPYPRYLEKRYDFLKSFVVKCSSDLFIKFQENVRNF